MITKSAIVLIVSILALSYCAVALVQAAWLSATPNFPAEQTAVNLKVWGGGVLFFLVIVIGYLVKLFGSKK